MRNWQSRIALICAAISGPLIIGGIAVLVFAGHPLSWAARGITGSAFALWIAFREMPPFYIEHWREGFEGERRTEGALRRLERAGWRVVHDVKSPLGNYDHIAVSHAGVFLLETKNLQGTVELRNGVPYLRRRLDPEDDKPWRSIRGNTLASAAYLHNDIERRTGHGQWVQAVVVFWSDFPAGLVEDDRCVFIHGPRLREWLQDRPGRLSQTEAEGTAACIASIAREAAAQEVAPPVRLSPA